MKKAQPPFKTYTINGINITARNVKKAWKNYKKADQFLIKSSIEKYERERKEFINTL